MIKLSSEFPMHVKPAREGVYRVRVRNDPSIWYARWATIWYMLSADRARAERECNPSAFALDGRVTSWQGLANEPLDEVAK